MGGSQHDSNRPPFLLRGLVWLAIRGRDAAHVVHDLEESFGRDLDRGMGRTRATMRYARNLVGSAWSIWMAALRRTVLTGIGLDTRLGLRMLVKQPLITLSAGLALGLGIPGSLALLHGLDVMFSEIPVPNSSQVMGIRHFDRSIHDPLQSSLDDYDAWHELQAFASIGAVRSYTVNVNAEEMGASPVMAAQMTASAFDVLQIPPLRGRTVLASDEVAGSPDVVVLGEDLWEARFGRDPDIIGSTVRIGAVPHVVIGVMPADFRFPQFNQVWLPLRARATDFVPGDGPRVMVFGRLADGVTAQYADAEVREMTTRRVAGDPERFEELLGEVVRMPILLLGQDEEVQTRREVVLLQALIFAALLVVCGNVGTLILARTAARSAELTIRTALGASRLRILTQLFVEALVLALVATGLGLVAANAFAVWLMQQFAPFDVLPYWADLTLTPRIVAIALGLAAICAAVAGVVPAISFTRRTIQANLQNAAARTGTVRFGMGSSLLIVGEIVLSVGFLALGGAQVRSVLLYQGAGPDFEPERYVMASLRVPEPDPLETATPLDSVAWTQRVVATQDELLTLLTQDPSVAGVGMGDHVPGLSSPNRDVILETPVPGFDPVEWDTFTPRVSHSFFAGLNRPILAGRDFNAGDVDVPPGTEPTAVIVNQSFVRHVLGGTNPLGKRLRYEAQGFIAEPLGDDEWYEIVGVVGPFGVNPRNSARAAAIYHPLPAGAANPIRYTVEVAGDPRAFVPRFRQMVASIDHTITVNPRVLADTMQSSSLVFRSLFLFVLAFAGVAFFLSAMGLYALMSFTVSQRTREIGIRTALGARRSDIVTAVARQAAVQIGAGLVLGVGWGWLLLNGQRTDITLEIGNIPITLMVTAAVAGCICLLACARPTFRSLRIQPTEALREL